MCTAESVLRNIKLWQITYKSKSRELLDREFRFYLLGLTLRIPTIDLLAYLYISENVLYLSSWLKSVSHDHITILSSDLNQHVDDPIQGVFVLWFRLLDPEVLGPRVGLARNAPASHKQ
jgi:hypothetical protein